MSILFPVSEEQIIRRIQFENLWWSTGQIDDFYSAMKPRLYYDVFWPLINQGVKRAVVLMGPRRVGKTVVLFHAIRDLIDSGVNPAKICYLSIETPIYNNIGLEQLMYLCLKAINGESANGFYFFFDEIQYLKNWEVHLKSLVDSYHQTVFVASGSATAALKLKSNESGAGRFTDFLLPPLTFREYIDLKDLGNLVSTEEIKLETKYIKKFYTTDIKSLNDHFFNYINYGGYPEILFSKQIQDNPGRYIRSDIIEKVLLRDLPSLYGITDVQELNSFFTYIAYRSGNQFSYEKLAQGSGVKKETLKKYLTYLESAFLVKIVNKVDNSAHRFKRNSQFKIYLTNPSLRSALLEPISQSDDLVGHVVETTLFAQMHFEAYYAGWKDGEVDLVTFEYGTKAKFVAEIKWSNRFFEKPYELKSLLKFCKENNLKEALVTTIDKRDIKEIDGIGLDFYPSALYCYILGENALRFGINPANLK